MPNGLRPYLRENFTVVLFAAIGGVLPHLVALHEYLLHPEGILVTIGKSHWSHTCLYALFYGLGLIVVAGLGSILCIAMKETQHSKALALGIAAPALIVILQVDSQKKVVERQIELVEKQAALKNARDHSPEQKTKTEVPEAFDDPFPKKDDANKKLPDQSTISQKPVRFGFSLIATVQAQTGPVEASKKSAAVEVYASRKSEAFVAEFQNVKEEALTTEAFGPGDSKRLLSPPGATGIRFKRGEFKSSPLQLNVPADYVLACEVRVTKEERLDFTTAFGRDPTNYEFKVNAATFPLAPIGTRGWVYAGKWTGNSWDSVYWTLPEGRLPAVGEHASVTFPLKVRPEPAKGTSVATLRVGQLAEVMTKPHDTGEGHIWIDVRVLKTADSEATSQ